MSRSPLVSVIIIFLNEATFIQEAIDSVLLQTSGDWELLLVDDGSTDASRDIARRCAEAHRHKVRYVDHAEHANRGMSASRNLGLRQARGRYIAYLDADDVWLPHKLAGQIAIMEAEPGAGMTYGPVECWYSWTGDPQDQSKDFTYGLIDHGFRLRGDRLMAPPELLCLFLRYESLVPTPSSIMVRKEAVERVGGSVETFRGAYEDGALYFKLGLQETVYVSTDEAMKYRIHPQSCSRTASRAGTMDADRMFFLRWAEGYLAHIPGASSDVREALQAALWQTQHPRLHDFQRSSREAPSRLIETGRRLARRLFATAAG